MRKTRFLAVAAAFALIFAIGSDALAQRGRGGGQGGGASLDEETILEEFDSIVELIWTDDEENAWDDIDNDDVAAKQAFIAAFWERRDPTPNTEANEFEEQWMARVSYAAGAFRGEGRNGWETDRGHFYLVYGPEPIVATQNKTVSGGAAGQNAETQRGGTSTNIVWTLDPSQNSFLDGKDEVVFGQYQRSYSKITGGIEYSQEAFLASSAIQAYFEGRRANPSMAGPTAAAGGGAPAGGAAAPAAGAATTPDQVAMQELMQSGTTHNDLSLQQEMGFIPAPGGNTFAMFNFELGKEGLTFESAGAPGPASLLAFGALFKADPAAAEGQAWIRDVKIDFTVDPSNGSAEETTTHSFGMTLEPGDYRLAWGVMDNASERMTTTDFEFNVPDYGTGELEVPSVIVANAIEEKPDAIDVNTIYDATRVGNLALSTDLDNEFGRSDNLLLLYFVRGLGVDAGTQAPSLKVSHRILIAGTGDSIARLPEQTLTFGAIQQEIPLGSVQQLQEGTDYEIEIHIEDLVNGNEITQRVPISIRAGA